jgi:excisionase family DNA binding protein
MTLPLLIKSSAAAARLGISRATLHRWVKAGRIAFVQIEKNSIYFLEEDIELFIQKLKCQMKPATI